MLFQKKKDAHIQLHESQKTYTPIQGLQGFLDKLTIKKENEKKKKWF